MSYPPPEQPPPPGYQPFPPAAAPPPPASPPPPAPPPPLAAPPPIAAPPPPAPVPPVAAPPAPIAPAPPVEPTPQPAFEPVVAPAPPVEPAPAEASPPKKKRKRPIGWIITVILLSLALIAVGVLFWLAYQRLQDALIVIEDQKEVIDEKENFSAAMTELLGSAAQFEGQKVGSLVNPDQFDVLASRAYAQRHDASALARIADDVRATKTTLDEKFAAAAEQRANNASGTTYESVIDSLGGGFVTTSVDDADSLCESDVLGCVTSDNPLVVHIDAADVSLPYMTEFIQQGVAYHEFAHVLQETNPAETDVALVAFSGDRETMADCYALTYLDGWTLHHTVPINNFEYYEVDIGYGYTCDETQRQAIIDWYESLGFVLPEVAQ